MGRLDGKIAIVTGGASGMGEATVRRFRSEGAEVVLADVKAERGQSIAADCGATFRELDVADEAGWDALMDEVKARHGKLHVLVNNAGILGAGSIDEIELGAWNRTLAVNLTGVMLGCRAAIRLIRNNVPQGGSIINVSSTAAYGAIADDVAYTASKSGVRMLSKAVAVSCARKGYAIRCNSVHPGAVTTSIHDELRRTAEDATQIDRFLAAMSPLDRAGRPDEVAALNLFLASDEASFITGGEYLVDGATMAAHPLV